MSGERVPPTHHFADQAPIPTSPLYQGTYLVPQPPRRNGSRIALGVAAVVAVSVGATFGVTALMHKSGTPQANPPISSSSSTPPAPTTPHSKTSSTTAPPTTPTSADSLTSLDEETSTTPTTSTTPPPTGAKPGCAEASRDLDAFNASNPAANGGKDYQIAADRDLASKLAADAKLATDPPVKTAIQSESDSWKKFADFYAAGDTSGMSNEIPKTSKAIKAVQDACSS